MVTMVDVVERNDFFKSFLPAVNSSSAGHRDISANPSGYRPYNDDYITIPSRLDRTIQPEHEPERSKKDKKWSFGKLFRRKKKEEESATSSETDEGVSTRSLSKIKAKKKKRTPAINNFDHIVIRDTRRAQSVIKPSSRDVTDDGILSDPSAGFINYRSRLPYHVHGESKESLHREEISRSTRNHSETPGRRTRKGKLKARVEALRNSMRGDSSSDEESVKSSTSSSMIRFRSEDSLMRSRDSSLNKRSRSARNERYIKRLSRDEENQLNKEAELLQQGYTKAEVEMLTRTPTSQSSGYGTCKRDQSNKTKSDPLYSNDMNRRPMKSESVSSFPSTTQSFPSSINFNAKVNNELINYSIPHSSNNTDREPLYANNNRHRSVSDQYNKPEDVMYIKFPLGNVTNIKREDKSPPVPPPRDMHRKVVTPVSMYYENNPIVADRTERSKVSHGVPNNDFERVVRRSQERSVSHGLNGLRRPISTSEDHIAMQNNDFLFNLQSYKNEQPRRPASVSAEPNHYGLYANSPPWRKKTEQSNIIKPEPVLRQDYLYYADHSPRSRRPISIKSSQNGLNTQYISDSQSSLNPRDSTCKKPRNASEFWKKLEDAENQRKHNLFANSRSNSDYTSSSQLQRNPPFSEQSRMGHIRSEGSDLQNKNRIKTRSTSHDTTDGAKMWKATTEYKRSTTVEPPKLVSPSSKTHVRHKSDTFVQNGAFQLPSDEEKSSERRKSTNLDDALNELEAIYNSLGLGDEDLLDRAERRELMTPKYNDHYNDWNGNNEELQLRSQPTTPLRRTPRRSTLPDKLQDDMAFRRMNSKEKPYNGYKDKQAQISYMLASPVYVPYTSDDDRHSDRNEPDIVHDDVVYRNIKQTNNRLKTIDPQPPFGIPVGPVTPAPQSDYLHAMPENKSRSRFIPRRSPDLVSDDLAYRSLRKDNRHSSVLNGEDFNGHVNNNHAYNDYIVLKDSPTNIKKKRAVRSLSANIFTMIQQEIDDALNMSKLATIQKTKSNSDVAKRLRDCFENNVNEQETCARNKVKQRHNTVGLFINNVNAPNHYVKDDSYIHHDDKYLAKPPSCDKSKSSSPSNRSPQTSKKASKDEFQQVLSMLAQEAMDTSNKLGVALAELDKNRSNIERKSDIQSKITDSRIIFLNGLTNRTTPSYPIQETKHVTVHSEPVKESKTNDMPESVGSSSKAQKTEDSLLAISDQLHKVEDQLKHSYEKEISFDDESLRLSALISNAEKELKAQEAVANNTDNDLVSESVPLAVNNDSKQVETTSYNNRTNPFRVQFEEPNMPKETTDNLKEINEIKAFKELKDGISNLIDGISQVNQKLSLPKVTISNNVNHDTGKISGITEATEKLNQVTREETSKNDIPCRASVNLSIYEDDLTVKKDATDSTEYNSSEELATIFQLEPSNKKKILSNTTENESVDGKRNDLSSPKLVQTMNQQLRRFSVDNTTEDSPSQSTALPTNVVPWRTKRQNHNSQKENRGEDTQPKGQWLDSPGTLMLACSYTLMFSQHFADLDWLTILGLILAIITIIAMLLI